MGQEAPGRDWKRLTPLLLSAAIILLDQATKLLVVLFVEPYRFNRHSIELVGDIVRIINIGNRAMAFSIGSQLAPPIQRILFIVLPLLVIGLLVWYFIREVHATTLQRWTLAGIIGGGIGNLIDRIFRSGGVVDFIDIKFWGLLGFERWPTFNVADSSVVVCGILMVVATFSAGRKEEAYDEQAS